MSSIWPGDRLRKKEWICLRRPGQVTAVFGDVVLQPGPDALNRLFIVRGSLAHRV